MAFQLNFGSAPFQGKNKNGPEVCLRPSESEKYESTQQFWVFSRKEGI